MQHAERQPMHCRVWHPMGMIRPMGMMIDFFFRHWHCLETCWNIVHMEGDWIPRRYYLLSNQISSDSFFSIPLMIEAKWQEWSNVLKKNNLTIAPDYQFGNIYVYCLIMAFERSVLRTAEALYTLKQTICYFDYFNQNINVYFLSVK